MPKKTNATSNAISNGTDAANQIASAGADGHACIDLVAAVQQATEADLIAIQQRIGELSNELESLKAIEKVVSIKLHGKATTVRAKRRGRCAIGGDGDGSNGNTDGDDPFDDPTGLRPGSVAELIHDHIAANGPACIEDLALQLGRSIQSLKVAMSRKSEWFHKNERTGRISIAVAGGSRLNEERRGSGDSSGGGKEGD